MQNISKKAAKRQIKHTSASFKVKPSQIKQLGKGRYAGRLRRSDITERKDEIVEIDEETINEDGEESHIKTWDELSVQIEARMKRDSDIEASNEKVIEERSAGYPHHSVLDG